MQIGNILGSRKARQTMAAIVALGVVQVPLVSLADASSPWMLKADQKKEKNAVHQARRLAQGVETVTRAPKASVEAVLDPQPVQQSQDPRPTDLARSLRVASVTPPAIPNAGSDTPVPVLDATSKRKRSVGWLFPVLGLGGLAALIAALGNDSNG